jgi:hypothetical protein
VTIGGIAVPDNLDNYFPRKGKYRLICKGGRINMQKQYRFLIIFIFIFIGCITGFLGIFALGPYPLPPITSPVYYIIGAAGVNVVVGLIYLFPVNKLTIRILSSILIICTLVPVIYQIVMNYYLMFPFLIMEIVVGIVTFFIPLGRFQTSLGSNLI